MGAVTGASCVIRTIDGFHLDDVCALVSQHLGADRSRYDRREINDANAVEGTGHGELRQAYAVRQCILFCLSEAMGEALDTRRRDNVCCKRAHAVRWIVSLAQ